MPAYLTVDEFKVLTTMPASYVTSVETTSPGFTLAKILSKSAVVDSRLRKRYGAPFNDPSKVPTIVKEWVAAMVTPEVFLKRGISGTDEQWQEYVKRADAAAKDLDLAANSETGLFDLPMHVDGLTGSGINQGGSQVYSEQSPYVWSDEQEQVGRQEDGVHTGTTRQ